MEKKLCPNCKMPMNKNFCMHCGYMENGSFISKKPVKATELEQYLGEDYEKIIRNKNFIIPGILGPVYLLAHNFYFTGIILIIIDSIISLLIEIFNHAFILYYIVFLFNIIYMLINRYIWSALGNIIYVKLLNKRIKKIKEKNPTVIDLDLEKYYKKDKRFIGIKYIFYGLVFLILFYLIRGMIYQYLQLV